MIYWLIFISLELWRNYYLIEKQKIKPDYGGSFIFRAFFGMVCLIIANPYFDPAGNPLTILQALPFAVFQLSSFYLLFDPILNLLRGKKWDYKGKDSGWLDKLPIGFYYALKIVCLAGLITSLIILL